MNEFVEQFLIEWRELVAQGNDDLLALEERPGRPRAARRRLSRLPHAEGRGRHRRFRRDGARLHAAEDVLSAVRSDTAPVTPALINLCLACLDQVSAWIDRMRSNGEVPADADAEADDLVHRFATLASP